MRYWHPRIWSDEKLVILHYIVDKPWERQIGPRGIAGHLGRDGEAHESWWDIYHGWWVQRKEEQKSLLVITAMDSLVHTEKLFTEHVALPQEVGKPEDVQPWS